MTEIEDCILSVFAVPPMFLAAPRYSREELYYINLWERGFFTSSVIFPPMTLPEVLETYVWGPRRQPGPRERTRSMTVADPADAVRNKMAGFGCCEGYRNDGIARPRAAVNAILGLHTCGPESENPACLGCGKPYPCLEVRLIAKAIGVPGDA